jgi:formylglycine-generating enzyme required for sulfatase activity
MDNPLVISGFAVKQKLETRSYFVPYIVEDEFGLLVEARVFKKEFPDNPFEKFLWNKAMEWRMELRHPGIRKVVAFGEYDNRPVVFLEYLKGDTYDKLDAKLSRMSDVQHRILWASAYKALAYAHEQGVLHGHISSSSLFLTADGRLKLQEFELEPAFTGGILESNDDGDYSEPGIFKLWPKFQLTEEALDYYNLNQPLLKYGTAPGWDNIKRTAGISDPRIQSLLNPTDLLWGRRVSFFEQLNLECVTPSQVVDLVLSGKKSIAAPGPGYQKVGKVSSPPVVVSKKGATALKNSLMYHAVVWLSDRHLREQYELQKGSERIYDYHGTYKIVPGACVPLMESGLVHVEGGTVRLGHLPSGENDAAEEFVEEVKSFAISRYAVTKALWAAVMGQRKPAKNWGLMPHDFNYTYSDLTEFFERLNDMVSEAMHPYRGRFRLPTEAEWEYAAKGGILHQGYQYAGSDNYEDVGILLESEFESSSYAYKVGQYRPNELGLYDMTGCVREICTHPYKGFEKTSSFCTPNLNDFGKSYWLLRGGQGWRVTSRGYVGGYESMRLDEVGFRMVWEYDSVADTKKFKQSGWYKL